MLPVLKRNIESVDAGSRMRLLPISALGLHKSGEPGQGAVDIASCAPPFPMLLDAPLRKRLQVLFTYVASNLLVEEHGVFVLEHPKELDMTGICGRGAPTDVRRTAASALSFWS